jgi:23S rRNA (guanosine2251-2'-O)-methyltransferase
MGKDSTQFYVIAHNIRSLHNVGSIFRTADAFGVTKIFLTGYTGRPDYYVHADKINKVALGAEKFVAWEHSKSPFPVIRKLKKDKVQIIALENNTKSEPLTKFKPKFPLALVLGEERRGVSKAMLALCQKAVEIPMQGKKESLNVSVAFGISAFYIAHFKK